MVVWVSNFHQVTFALAVGLYVFTKTIYQPQSNNLQTWGIWVSDVHRPTWIEFRGRLSKSALKRQHTGVLKDAAIAPICERKSLQKCWIHRNQPF
jgi:hypothetical protein